MTPHEIDCAIAICIRGWDGFLEHVPESMARQATIEWFHACNMIVKSTGYYIPTEKLRAYVEALQKVPLPTQKYVVDWKSLADAQEG